MTSSHSELRYPRLIDVSDGHSPPTGGDEILACYGTHSGPCPLLGLAAPDSPVENHGVVLAINRRDPSHHGFAERYAAILTDTTRFRLVDRRSLHAIDPNPKGDNP